MRKINGREVDERIETILKYFYHGDTQQMLDKFFTQQTIVYAEDKENKAYILGYLRTRLRKDKLKKIKNKL